MKMNLESGALIFIEIEDNNVDFVFVGTLQANFPPTHSICGVAQVHENPFKICREIEWQQILLNKTPHTDQSGATQTAPFCEA